VSESTTDPPVSIYGRRVIDQARRIGTHPNTIYRQIHKHGLVATLVGAVWYVRDADLEDHFAARTAARLKKPAPIDQKAHDVADRALTEGGW
jgi:hypothetical protein